MRELSVLWCKCWPEPVRRAECGPTRLAAALLVSVLLASTLAPVSEAATCSCAGVPLLGTLSGDTPDKGDWYVGSSLEVRDVSDLVRGGEEVPDETGRDRETQSLIVQTGYGITDRWFVASVFSMVDHDRQVGASQTRGCGLGDAIIMARFTPAPLRVYNHTSTAFGIGVRLPLGEDGDRRADGILLSEDKQRGRVRGVLSSGGRSHMRSTRLRRPNGSPRRVTARIGRTPGTIVLAVR